MTYNSEPSVSVIIPTYNHAHFLNSCLKSVINQTYENWEAIVLNNYSIDNTVDVIEGFKDSRIKLFNFSNNGIIAASRNEGIRLAKADLIAFLDSDDLWYPEKLSRCIEAFTADIDLVWHSLNIKINGKTRGVLKGSKRGAQFYNLLYNNNCIYTSSVVVRKKCLLNVRGFNENKDFVTSEDYDLWLKLSKYGINCHYIGDVLGEYFLHGSNASKVAERHLVSILQVINSHFAEQNKSIYNRLRFRRRLASVYASISWLLFQERNMDKSLDYCIKGIFNYPFYLKNIIILFLCANMKLLKRN